MLMPSYKLVTHCICRTDLRPSLEDSRRKIGERKQWVAVIRMWGAITHNAFLLPESPLVGLIQTCGGMYPLAHHTTFSSFAHWAV